MLAGVICRNSVIVCCIMTLLALAGAGELTFELPDNEKMCFYEFVQKGVECVLEYQVYVSALSVTSDANIRLVTVPTLRDFTF